MKPLKATQGHYSNHRDQYETCILEDASATFLPGLLIMLFHRSTMLSRLLPTLQNPYLFSTHSKPNNPTLHWSAPPQNPLSAQYMCSRTVTGTPCFACLRVSIVFRAQTLHRTGFHFCNLSVLYGLISWLSHRHLVSLYPFPTCKLS